MISLPMSAAKSFTLGQKPTFYPEITKKLMFEKCEFCEKWDFENVNLVKNETLEVWIFWKNEILKMWILWKMRLWKCEFCEKWDFENVNFVEKWDFEKVNFVKKVYSQNVNFWMNYGFLSKCELGVYRQKDKKQWEIQTEPTAMFQKRPSFIL